MPGATYAAALLKRVLCRLDVHVDCVQQPELVCHGDVILQPAHTVPRLVGRSRHRVCAGCGKGHIAEEHLGVTMVLRGAGSV